MSPHVCTGIFLISILQNCVKSSSNLNWRKYVGAIRVLLANAWFCGLFYKLTVTARLASKTLDADVLLGIPWESFVKDNDVSFQFGSPPHGGTSVEPTRTPSCLRSTTPPRSGINLEFEEPVQFHIFSCLTSHSNTLTFLCLAMHCVWLQGLHEFRGFLQLSILREALLQYLFLFHRVLHRHHTNQICVLLSSLLTKILY